MSKISVIIFVAFLAGLVIGLPNSEPHVPRPGYCHNDGRYIKQGEGVSAQGHCAQLFCRDAAKNDLSTVTCGLIAITPGCELKPEDNVTPYPKCCARNICKDDH